MEESSGHPVSKKYVRHLLSILTQSFEDIFIFLINKLLKYTCYKSVLTD